VINLSGLNINIESLNDKFIEKDFSDEVNSKLYLKEFRKVLSKREKEVFNYIFIKLQRINNISCFICIL
jgi:hypothetical protein